MSQPIHVHIFQSCQWEKFQKLEGRETFNLNNHQFRALIIKYSLPFNKSYLYCPQGPIWLDQRYQHNPKFFQSFLDQAREIVQNQKSIFLRIDNLELNEQISLTKNLQPAPNGYFHSAVFLSPSEAILNIQPPNKILFQKMKPKTRYNIRLSLKKNLTINEFSEEKLDDFYSLLQETSQRNHFFIHPKIHYRHLLQAFKRQSKIYLVKFQDKILAGGLYVFWNSTVYYLHGASSSEYRNLMPTHFLHWQVIQEAKKQNYQFYNFGGVSPQIESSPWQSVDQFKYNFGAKKIVYPWANDLINQSFWYKSYLFRHWLLK